MPKFRRTETRHGFEDMECWKKDYEFVGRISGDSVEEFNSGNPRFHYIESVIQLSSERVFAVWDEDSRWNFVDREFYDYFRGPKKILEIVEEYD